MAFDPSKIQLSKPTWVQPTISDEILAQARARLATAHHLDGCAIATDRLPLLFFQVPHDRPIDPLFIAWGWDGYFGATLTVSMMTKGGGARVCIYPDQPVFENIRQGHFVAIFVRAGNVITSCEVDLTEATDDYAFAPNWDRVRNHVPGWFDPEARYWEGLRLLGAFKERLTPTDRLSIGWSQRFERIVYELCGRLRQEGPAPEYLNPDPEPPKALRGLIEALGQPDVSGPALVAEAARAAKSDSDLLAFLASNAAYYEYCHATTEHRYCTLHNWVIEAYFASPEVTKAGTRFAWIDKVHGGIRMLDLDPAGFPPSSPPEQFWEFAPTTLPFYLGAMVTGADAPAPLGHESPLWNELPIAEDVAETNASADALIEEAVASRKWTIPRGALWQLRVGPFVMFQTFELDTEVFFIARTASGAYVQLILDLDEKRLHLDALRFLEDEDKGEAIRAGLKLLVAAFVRDFFVVEERERVFATKTDRRPPSYLRQNDDSPITVYLPRVRYVGRPNLTKCAQELDHNERRAHFVRAHLRKSDAASEHQVILAKRYGFAVPAGHTFVRPHQRGAMVERQTIYRSRSALASLYEVQPSPAGKAPIGDWFQFERDVRALMDALGFEVEHVAASRHGDHGVDVLARKGHDLDEVTWVIQCKCNGPKNKVGPRVIRELAGALHAHPRGTRGMVVTTSKFTSGARTLAATENIRLMDGEEFLRLVKPKA